MTDEIFKSALEVTRILALSKDVSIRTVFQNAGFKDIQVIRDEIDSAAKIIRNGGCDLLLMEDVFEEQSTVPFIRSIRQGEIGENIFLPIILMISENDASLIRSSINSGPDDVVIKPLSVSTISTRIVGLLKRNIQYVVTRDYIGPNRRPKERTDPEKDGLIDIPNIIKAKAEGHHAVEEQIRRKINEANTKINAVRISIQGDQIHQLISDAIKDPADFNGCIEEVRTVATEFSRRLRNTGLAHVSDLCRMLNVVTRRLQGFDDKRNVELLVLLGQAIGLSFREDMDSRVQAMQVVDLVRAKFAEEMRKKEEAKAAGDA